MRVLVTGGAGFIGSHIVEHFHRVAEVRVLDNLRSGFRRNLVGMPVEFIEASILDRGAVRHAMAGVDYVFHLAAMISVPESVEHPVECTEINTIGSIVVLEEAARAGVQKLVFSSSAAIYGDRPTNPKCETMLPDPRSPYAITKLDGEYYCQLFAAERRLATACLRYFNVFGPRQDPQSRYAAAVPRFINRAQQQQPILVHGDGEQTRDFVYVKDIVAANVLCARNPAAMGVYNVASGRAITINQLAATISQLTKSASPIIHTEARAGDVKHSVATIARLRELGYAATVSFDSGLQATIDYFQDAARC